MSWHCSLSTSLSISIVELSNQWHKLFIAAIIPTYNFKSNDFILQWKINLLIWIGWVNVNGSWYCDWFSLFIVYFILISNISFLFLSLPYICSRSTFPPYVFEHFFKFRNSVRFQNFLYNELRQMHSIQAITLSFKRKNVMILFAKTFYLIVYMHSRTQACMHTCRHAWARAQTHRHTCRNTHTKK